MTDDAKLKHEERVWWERVAMKAIEFVPIQKSGEVYDPGQMADRASRIATALVRERRDAFSVLELWDEEPNVDVIPDADPPTEVNQQTQGATCSRCGESYAIGANAGAHSCKRGQPQTFDDGLVERLCPAYMIGWAEFGTDRPLKNVSVEERTRAGVRAILSELAMMPVEMPTACELQYFWRRSEILTVDGHSSLAVELFRARLGPILAAKDFRNQALENGNAELSRQIAAKGARIAELAQRVAQSDTPINGTG